MSDYALEGPKWSSSALTWSFATAGGNFSNAITGAYQSIIQAALNRWTQVTNITFKQVADSTSGNVNLRIGWATFSGSQIGETDYSYQQSANPTFISGTQVRLEDPSARSVGSGMNDRYSGTATTLYQAVLHEIGHALGLAHSTNPSAVMYPSLGASDTDLSAADIQGIQTLYGSNGALVTSSAAAPAASPANSAIAIYRFFDASNGTQFLTSSLSERNTIISTRPDLSYEGIGMGGLSSPAGDPNAVPVYRFFNTHDGSHFFTTSQAENAQLLATRSDLVPEQVTFYEHATQAAGDTPVYRFFDSSHGTHFFTSSASESATLASTRTDLKFEGIAFYAPSSSGSNASIQVANSAAAANPSTVSLSDDMLPIYRLDNADGQQLLTSDPAERDAILATQPTFSYEGVMMGGISPTSDDDDAAPVFRFFNAATGDHFLTADANEAAQLATSRPDMVQEQTTFYEHLTQQDGDVAVYRFFDTANGTHFYTANAAERSALSVRPDMAAEGIAFYAPST